MHCIVRALSCGSRVGGLGVDIRFLRGIASGLWECVRWCGGSVCWCGRDWSVKMALVQRVQRISRAGCRGC